MSKKNRRPNEQQTAGTARGVRIVLAIAILAIALFYLSRRQNLTSAANVNAATASGAMAPAATSNAVPSSAKTESFGPTVVNHDATPGSAPGGMAWIPGGEFSMGANDPPDMDDIGMKATLDARPIHRVYVDGFYMDKTDM